MGGRDGCSRGLSEVPGRELEGDAFSVEGGKRGRGKVDEGKEVDVGEGWEERDRCGLEEGGNEVDVGDI